MRVPRSARSSSRHGYALPMILIFSAIGIIALSSALQSTSQMSFLNDRNNLRAQATTAAEAATEKVLTHMLEDFKVDGERQLAANLASYRLMIPTKAEDAYWGNFGFRDPRGPADRTYVERTANYAYVPLDSKYEGLSGFATTYRIISNARIQSGGNDVTVAVQQEVQFASIPVFQFAIFYNSLLEFTWAAPLVVRGRVHANNNIYTGSSASLEIQDDVTATGVIQKRSWGGYNLSAMTGSITFGGDKETNTSALTLPIGTNNTANAVREILNQPKPAESMNSPMGQQRMYNKAELVIVLSNSTARILVKKPFDPVPAAIPLEQTAYFMSNDKTFTDQRQGEKMTVTELDIGKFNTWAATNVSVKAKLGNGTTPNILYVADERTHKIGEVVTSKTTSKKVGKKTVTTTTYTTNFINTPIETAVRVVNGRTLPSRGLTLATPNPLYVLGHFNQPNSSHLGTPNTSQTKPAALMADALTVQSPNWLDSKSANNFKDRRATHTTVNAALLTGIVYAGGSDGTSPKSGGVVNYPRLLEDWSGGVTLTLNGSLVSLFNSARATAPFQSPGYYYYAPNRSFNFDPNFKDPNKLPPGTPELRVLIRKQWKNPLPNQT